MQKIFVVEDDDSIREMVLYALSSAGFETAGFSDGIALFEEMQKNLPDLILLDIMLPGEDGLSILRKLRTGYGNKHIPIIMLTAKGSELDRITGLDLGADDYITKPFSILEAVSRVKAVLRRTSPPDSKVREIQIGDIVLHSDKRVVVSCGEEVNLTFKEFELLYFLMINRDIVLSREKLLSEVWGFDYSGENRTVDVHIKSLRQKLGDSGVLIKTVRNVGYKITMPPI